jgi:manganese-dependent ADP-ribose/CDP-alcohol diphosphatase
MNRRNFIGLSAAASLSVARGAEAGAKPLLSFGLITDVQYADADPSGERHYRASIPKLKTAVTWLAKQNLPFTLHLGDLIDRDFKSFDAVLPLLGGLGHPVRHLLGNHDYSVAESQKQSLAAKLGMPADRYSFHSGGVRFVMLDTNEVSVYKHPEGSPEDRTAEAMLAKLTAEKVASATKWNGGLSKDQLSWLDGELAAADLAGEPVILCGHHPILPQKDQAWNADDVTTVIDRHPSVRAYFNGHNHAGDEFVRNGIPYITFKSILHEPAMNAYSAIRLFADRLEIIGNGREKSRVFPLKRG